MAFGKIAVRTASGEIEEYELTKPTTSVGRQPGNDIVLPTSAVSRYHAQFDVSEGSVYLVDLGTVNGTFVNDQQLEQHGRVNLSDGDTIVIGDVELEFYAPEARSGSKRAALNLDPQARVLEQSGVPFRMVLDEPQQSVAPGARLQMTLVLENLTDHEIPVSIDLGGLDPEWAKSNRREAILEPGIQTQAMISVRPPRSSQTKPGVYPLTIRVVQTDDPARALEAVREIDVVGYAGLGVAVRSGRSSDTYHLAVQNQGNVPIDIQMEGYHREKQLRFRYSPERFNLAPGATEQVTLTVHPAGGQPFGSRRELTFAVVARSMDKAGFRAPVISTYTLQPSWPKWVIGAAVPILFGVLVVLALLLGVLSYVGIIRLPEGLPAITGEETKLPSTEQPAAQGTTGPTPTLVATLVAEIGDFSATPESPIYQTRGAVTLRWDVAGGEQITLVGPDGLPIDLSPANLSTRHYEISIADLALGPNQYSLTVTGSDGQNRTRTLVINTTASSCTVNEGVDAFSQPDPTSEPLLDFEGGEVIIVGRTSDSAFVRIAYGDLTGLDVQGWVPADQVLCGPSSPPLSDYLIVSNGSAGTEEPKATATP